MEEVLMVAASQWLLLDAACDRASNSFALALSFKWTIALVGGDETRRKRGSPVRRAIAAPVHTSSKGRQWPHSRPRVVC